MNRSNVEEIKARLPIEEVIGSYLKLEKAGKSYKAKCPFHNEKTASFFVSPDRGGYYCFGCNAKGDIFTFVEQFEGLDFRGALKVLADKAGVQLVFNEKADSERDKLFEIMENATKYFEEQLSKDKEAQEYIAKRGINESTRKLFRLGYAPLAWRSLFQYLRNKGESETLLEKAGLIKKGEKNNEYYDRFRGRIIFPINDSSGRPIAFSGRIIKDDGQSAKYLNSPDTPLYDKSAVLYGLDKAKSEIRRMGYSILVEGQMDLVMSHQAGIKNTVAASGTALTEEIKDQNGIIGNLGLARRLSPNIIIAFDSDSAGRKAGLRAAGIALRLGMDVKMADIVGGKDPADLVKEDIEKWKDVLRNAKPVVEFELNNVLREVKDERKLLKAINERVLPIIAAIESNSDQSYFIQMIGSKIKVPIDTIWHDLKVVEKRLKSEQSTEKNIINPLTSTEIVRRVDIIERRLFGLILLMEREGFKDVSMYRERIQKIAGESYTEMNRFANSLANDLLFEAESFFGNDKDNWCKQIEEILINFEEDLIAEELIKTMQALKIAESNKDNSTMMELAKKCQSLSIRKAEINKKKKF